MVRPRRTSRTIKILVLKYLIVGWVLLGLPWFTICDLQVQISTSLLYLISEKKIINKAGVINDPLSQTHSHASSERCFLLFCFSRFEKWGRTYGQHVRKQWSLPAVTLGWPSGSMRNMERPTKEYWHWKYSFMLIKGCPRYRRIGHKRMFFNKNSKNFDQANQFCQRCHGTLVEPRNFREHKWAARIIRRSGIHAACSWLGISDEAHRGQ